MIKRKRSQSLSEINVVPYIDVMLVLLVIFMITAPLLTQGVNVNLPQASAKSLPPQQAEPIVVSVDQQGQYYLNTSAHPEAPVKSEALANQVTELLAAAQQKNQKRDVYVKGDKSANYGQVIDAMVLLQKAGVDKVGLITQPGDVSSIH